MVVTLEMLTNPYALNLQVLEYEGDESEDGDFGEDGEEYSVRVFPFTFITSIRSRSPRLT